MILPYKGKNHLIKKDIRAETDQLSHVYTLRVMPNNTYQVLIDLEAVAEGSLEEDWDMLPPKKIKDPKAKKPEDWDEREKIPDPKDVKPKGWDDIPATIPDPDAKKPEGEGEGEPRRLLLCRSCCVCWGGGGVSTPTPARHQHGRRPPNTPMHPNGITQTRANNNTSHRITPHHITLHTTHHTDWDDEDDGEWEAPTIPNPDYKGEWKQKMIDNPAYKGKWVAPDIDNPEYKADKDLHVIKDTKYVGFELWQVKAGSIFDNSEPPPLLLLLLGRGNTLHCTMPGGGLWLSCGACWSPPMLATPSHDRPVSNPSSSNQHNHTAAAAAAATL